MPLTRYVLRWPGRLAALLILLLVLASTTFGQGRPDIVWMKGITALSAYDLRAAPDGQTLFLVGQVGVKRIRIADGQILRSYGPAAAGRYSFGAGFALSSDGHRLAVQASDPGSVVAIFDVDSGALVKTLPLAIGSEMAFSTDGTYLKGGGNGQYAVVRVADGTSTFETHQGWGLTFAPDGQSFLVGQSLNNGRVERRRTSDGTLLSAWPYDSSLARPICYFPDGQRVVVSANGTVGRRLEVRDAVTGERLAAFPAQNRSDYSGFDSRAYVSSDGRTVYGAGIRNDGVAYRAKFVERFDVASGARTAFVESNLPESYVSGYPSAELGPDLDSAFFVSEVRSDGGYGQRWVLERKSLSKGALVRTYDGPGNRVSAIAWSPDSSRVASGGSDGHVQVWRAADGELLEDLDMGTGVGLLSFSRDGAFLAAGGGGGLQLWTRVRPDMAGIGRESSL